MRHVAKTLSRSVWLLLSVCGACVAQTWDPLPISSIETLRAVYFHDDALGWAAGYNGALIHTDNGGQSWSPQASLTTQRLLSVRFVDANTGWIGAGRHIARSTNGGGDWTAYLIDNDARFFRNALFPVSAVSAWAPAVCGICAQRWFYRYSVTGPDTVAEQAFDLVGSGAQFLDLYFVDPDNGWSVGTFGLIRRISQANSDTPQFSNQNSGTVEQLNGVFMLNATVGWIVGNEGTVLTTTDGGGLWTSRDSETSANLRSVHFRDALNGWAVGEQGTILVSADGGVSWASEDSGISTTLWSVVARESVYASGGDAANSGNSVVLKRSAPDPRVFHDGFEEPG